MRRSVATVTLLAALATGCAGAEEPAEPRDVSTIGQPASPSPEPSPTPTDPFAIPEEIDEAYVTRVLDALEVVETETLTLTLASEVDDLGLPPAEIMARLTAVTTGAEFEDSVSQAIVLAGTRSGPGTPFRDPLGPARWEVLEVRELAEGCVAAKGVIDLSARLNEPPADVPAQWVILVADEERAPNEINPTPWLIATVYVPDGDLGEPGSDRCTA